MWKVSGSGRVILAFTGMHRHALGTNGRLLRRPARPELAQGEPPGEEIVPRLRPALAWVRA